MINRSVFGDYPAMAADASAASPLSSPAEPDEGNAVSGDRANAFVREHLPFVWRVLRRFGVPESDAADATQQVFIVATARLGLIEPGRERAFLFGTALRVASKVKRSKIRKPLVAAREEHADPDAQESGWPSTEELVDRKRARALLDAVLGEMDDDLRAVFVLYEIEQLTMAEIAQFLDVPAGTVASRLRRARELFQQGLARRSAPRERTP